MNKMNKFLLIISCITISLLSFSDGHAQTPCVTGSSVASEGSFSVGYKITYETLTGGGASDRDVKIIVELFDTDKSGLVAFLKENDPPTFTEQNFDSAAGQVFTKTLTGLGLADGATISYGCKFAFAGGLAVTDYIDYEVGFDCAATNDVIVPDSFTATLGAITPFSVEFLLNANDASGTVVYNVAYNGIVKTTSAPAGVQTSYVVSGLTSNTAYNFNVSASDLTGNTAVNNPIPLAASTTTDTSTACQGTSAEAEQGAFEVGYNYAFETLANGTDVKFTFELLDNKIGVVAYLWRSPPMFSETLMTVVSGQTFTLTVPNQTAGTTITYACKFAFQGGQAVTKYFNYDVGDDCALGTKDFALESFKAYPNPSQDNWVIESKNINMASIKVYDVLGKQVLALSPDSNEANINGSSLKSGLYFAQIKTAVGISSLKLVKN